MTNQGHAHIRSQWQDDIYATDLWQVFAAPHGLSNCRMYDAYLHSICMTEDHDNTCQTVCPVEKKCVKDDDWI